MQKSRWEAVAARIRALDPEKQAQQVTTCIFREALDLDLGRTKVVLRDFPGGAVVKNPPASAGDTGSSPGPGRSHMPRNN